MIQFLIASSQMRNYVCAFLFVLLFLEVAAKPALLSSQPSTDVAYAHVATDPLAEQILTKKIFPALTLLINDGVINQQLSKNKVLAGIKTAQLNRVRAALKNCADVRCIADSLKWNTNEIASIGTTLVSFTENSAFKQKIQYLKKNSSYALFADQSDTAFVRLVWEQSATAINQLFNVYLKAQKGRYPKIDSISFAPGDQVFRAQVVEAITTLSNGRNELVFNLPLNAAIKILLLNGRDEAARFVPLNGGMNELPFKRINKIKWENYKYSAILVPGRGPEIPGQRLDSVGMQRCEAAVERFNKGLAPFIVVSGGNVHPFRTPYNEAVEMKNYLVKQLHIPEAAIFIEPDARHTTTNLRNVSRMVYQFKMPLEKPILVVTDKDQTDFMLGGMGKTAMRDLGYLPYLNLKKLSNEDTELTLNPVSIQVDPFDPMDP